MMPLGTKAPDFRLIDVVDGQEKTLAQLRGNTATVIVFMCNHCPFVKHVADQLAKIPQEYIARGVTFIGINSNDAEAYPDDSPEAMKKEVKSRGYRFPYLYDESQEVARAYRAACTPDFFVFNEEMKLVYRGQLDDSRPNSDKPLTGSDLRAALDALIEGKEVSDSQRPSIGCNIKWKKGKEPDYFETAQVK